LRVMATALERGGEAVRPWPLESDGFPAIAEGLKKTFRRAGTSDTSAVSRNWSKRSAKDGIWGCSRSGFGPCRQPAEARR
jgi:hypothetical protein